MKGPRAAVAVALALMLVGCAGISDRTGSNTSSPTSSPSDSMDTSPLVVLESGTHAAPSFWPPLTFTAQDGWLIEREAEGLLALVPDTDENRERIEAGGYALTFVNVLPNINAAAEDCGEAAAPGIELTATDIVGALATRPGLSTDGPVAVTIGGLSGQQLDLALAPGWTGTCGGGGPFVPLVYSPGFIWWGAEPGEQWRIIVLDVAGLPRGMYATVMIIVYSAATEAWDDHLAASTEVIESFEFDTTPPGP